MTITMAYLHSMIAGDLHDAVTIPFDPAEPGDRDDVGVDTVVSDATAEELPAVKLVLERLAEIARLVHEVDGLFHDHFDCR